MRQFFNEESDIAGEADVQAGPKVLVSALEGVRTTWKNLSLDAPIASCPTKLLLPLLCT